MSGARDTEVVITEFLRLKFQLEESQISIIESCCKWSERNKQPDVILNGDKGAGATQWSGRTSPSR